MGFNPGRIDPLPGGITMKSKNNGRNARFLCSAISMAGLMLAAGSHAETVTINYVDSGWYNTFDLQDPDNENYLVGTCSSFTCNDAAVYRNFFVFDLSAVTGTITFATLRLYNPSIFTDSTNGYQSADASETYELYSYEGSIDDLVNSAGSYADLGDGTFYGTVDVSAFDNGQIVSVELNDGALADLNGASGLFALGGRISTLSGIAVDEGVFFGSTLQNDADTRELVLTVVPADTDGDGVADAEDNCIEVSNALQRDTDGDGFGNRCDADLNNSGFVNYADLAVLIGEFGSKNENADLDGDGMVSFSDLEIFVQLFGRPPGPSAFDQG